MEQLLSSRDSGRGGWGPAVRAIREATGITVTELADRIGISRPYLSNIEAGRRALPRRHVRAVADALGVSPAAILWAPDAPGPAELDASAPAPASGEAAA